MCVKLKQIMHSLLNSKEVNYRQEKIMNQNMDRWNDVLAGIVSQFSANVGTLHRLNPDDDHLYLVGVTKGMPEQVLAVTQRIPVGKGIAGTAAKTKEPTTMCNLQTDESGVAKPGAKATKAQGSLCVPVFHGDEVIGTLGIGYFTERDFTEEETDKLLEIGRSIAPDLMKENV